MSIIIRGLWVWIPGTYTGWTFFKIICCKWLYLVEGTENKKNGQGWPFYKKLVCPSEAIFLAKMTNLFFNLSCIGWNESLSNKAIMVWHCGITYSISKKLMWQNYFISYFCLFCKNGSAFCSFSWTQQLTTCADTSLDLLPLKTSTVKYFPISNRILQSPEPASRSSTVVNLRYLQYSHKKSKPSLTGIFWANEIISLTLENYFQEKSSQTKSLFGNGGDAGLVILTFYSDDPSLNPTYSYLCKI